MQLIRHARAAAGALPPARLALLLALVSAALVACGQGSGGSGY